MSVIWRTKRHSSLAVKLAHEEVYEDDETEARTAHYVTNIRTYVYYTVTSV